jgi:hypothetical protein
MCVNYSTIAAELYNQVSSLVLLLCHDIRCYYNQYEYNCCNNFLYHGTEGIGMFYTSRIDHFQLLNISHLVQLARRCFYARRKRGRTRTESSPLP